MGKEKTILLKTEPHFSGEKDILQGILESLNNCDGDDDRLQKLTFILIDYLSEKFQLQAYQDNFQKRIDLVKRRIQWPRLSDRFPKIVIFTSFTQTCSEIVRYLSSIFGEKSIVSHQWGESSKQLEDNFQQFKTDPHCFILVCDRTGEEGRNLQFADGLIHFDLPWSPNQLEQRLGRVDRIGGKRKIQSWALTGLQESPHIQFYRILRDGLHIFEDSIASLQFYIDRKLMDLENRLFRDNFYLEDPEKFQDYLSEIHQEIEQERIQIDEQNSLDEIELLDDNLENYFIQLDDYDAKHKTIKQAIEGLLCDGFQVRRNTREDIYSYSYQKSRYRETLIPSDRLREYFTGCLDRSGTYNRRIANKNAGVCLYRIGERLIESLYQYTQWDDRGQAFALWRYDENWDASEGGEWLGFRFDYIIEADLKLVKHIIEQFAIDHFNLQALTRKISALFPPRIETIFLHEKSLEIVENERLLQILKRPYNKRKGDYNLAKKRINILNDFIASHQWESICYEARERSEKLLCDRPSFSKHCQRCFLSAQNKLDNQYYQLEYRLFKFSDNEDDIQKQLTFEKELNRAILAGIYHPRVHPDSVGFLIVSGRYPRKIYTEEDK